VLLGRVISTRKSLDSAATSRVMPGTQPTKEMTKSCGVKPLTRRLPLSR
jgi:hypothetical protein